MARSSTSFQKGCPGGPGRRRGSKNVATRYKEEIKQHFGDSEFAAVVKAMTIKAVDGDVAAAKLLLSYRLGAPVAHVETKAEMSITGSESAAEALSAAFNLVDVPAEHDDEDDEFDANDPALDYDDSPEGSDSAIQHVEDSPDTERIAAAVVNATAG